MTGTITVTNYFGGCPQCGGNDGYVNAGRTHVCFCLAHRVSWIAGANIFSDWRHETEAEQRERYKIIEGFERIECAVPEGVWSADPEVAVASLTRRNGRMSASVPTSGSREMTMRSPTSSRNLSRRSISCASATSAAAKSRLSPSVAGALSRLMDTASPSA